MEGQDGQDENQNRSGFTGFSGLSGIRNQEKGNCSLSQATAMNPATLKPQHYAGQPDSRLLQVIVICSANVI